MSALSRVQAVFWLTVLASFAGASWGFGPVLKTGSSQPSNLRTVLGDASRPEEVNKAFISCYNILNGSLLDCRFVMTITGLADPTTAPENSGGHSHVAGTVRDLGELRFGGGSGNQVTGQTMNAVVRVEQRVPEVSGKIETELDLFVPPGWFTVFPQSFDASRSFWRFITRLDVTVAGLSMLPTSPTGTFIKVRGNDMSHTDAVAFYGTGDALLFLNAIADNYRLLTADPQNPAGVPLSVNDMSLIAGGYFDLNLDWRSPAPPGRPKHVYHRVGTSVDINRQPGGDCLQNKTLRAVVDLIMPVDSRSPIARRPNAPGFERSRFL